MEIREILKSRRNALGLTMAEVARYVGVSEGAVSRWESGNIANMRRSKIAALAKILQLDPGLIVGWGENSKQFSKRVLPVPQSHMIPVIGAIACRASLLCKENIGGYEPCPDFVSADFCLHCEGDSMINARIYDGDTVFIQRQKSVENGEIAAVEISDGGSCKLTLKRFYQTGNAVLLCSENPKYLPIIFADEKMGAVKVVGKAVFFVSRIK